MRRISFIATIFAITWQLSGCSSNPMQIHYYTLFNTPQENQRIAGDSIETRVQVTKIQLADYLRQTSLVMQTNEHKLLFSRQHQWAENLQKGMEKALLHSLNQQSATVLYVGPNEPKRPETAYELVVHVENLLPTTESEVIASGQFWLRDRSSDKVLVQERFFVNEPLEQDGYNHAVSKMRTLVEKIAENIHRQW